MLLKTHIAIGIFAALFLVGHVTHDQFFFIGVVIFASILPDIDSAFSTIGKHRIFRVLQFVTNHRGMIHSFTVCFIIAFILALYWPTVALPFFLGYGLHLFADSFTVDGIRPLWPLQKRSAGVVRVGSTLEEVIFVMFCILSMVAFVFLFI